MAETIAERECRLKMMLEQVDSANPSSIYSWSIGHILEHEFFCYGRLGSQGSKEKKVDLRNSEQLFVGKKFKIFY